MTTHTPPLTRTPSVAASSRCKLSLAVAAALFTPLTQGGETQIADQPLATRAAVQAKPNLLVVLDNSGSMNWTYMPDDLGKSQTVTDEPYTNWYGYWSSQCNGTAYDPNEDYLPPLKADGVSTYANANFGAAKDDGYSSSSATTDLANTFYYRYTGTQTRMDWQYTTDGVVNNNFYRECSSQISDFYAYGKNSFQKVTMTSTSADAQKYANWYSYYRHRYTLMRTSMGRALAPLDDKYRVGFSTISDTGAVDGTNYFRDVKDFGASQKTNVYSSLYSVNPNGSTPLRSALAKAGRYFANKVTGQTYDPMQYACQRNYTLLSTDGYWNGSKGMQLNGSSEVGQQDDTEDRPMRDSSQSVSTKVVTYATPSNTPATRTQTSNTQTKTQTWKRDETTYASSPNTGGCSGGKYKTTKLTARQFVQSKTQYFVTQQTSQASYTVTTVTTDGTVTSGPTRAPSTGYTYSSWSNNGAAQTNAATDPEPTSDSTFTGGSSSNNCVTLPNGSPLPGTVVKTTPVIQSSWTSSWTPSTLTYSYSTPAVTTLNSTEVITPSTIGGISNTLADVAEYYYKTDLRTSTLSNCTSSSSGSSQDVCSNIVREGASTTMPQHMNTFTIGLGIKGTLPYTDATLSSLTSGAIRWPDPGNTSSGNGDAVNIDDLWHAAINGRGNYYSAQSADDLNRAISSVINSVGETLGAASAASTSTLELVSGNNNQVFRASYTTSSWFGDLEAFAMDGSDASIATTASWSAKTLLDAKAASTRLIYFNGSSGLSAFTYANLTATQKAYFANLCSPSTKVAQCATLSATELTAANDGTKLVNYLRGDRTYESATGTGTSAMSPLFRQRAHVLGDIINGAPVHVAKPPFSYGDTGYADFVAAQANRKPVVYVAANDGMLHAFSADSADGGTELWAFVPSAVMPSLYQLANTNYANNHQYYVDGAPVMGDIKVGSTWKTILVGGLNKGGKSYYALDITDPTSPVMLWEFTDANMGLTYGNPIISKRADGTWVVAVTSGYNNSTGDGQGHLYILNANTGAVLLDVITSEGSPSSPSGLAKINAWVEDTSDNTSLRYYGGDQLGNVWRFDIDDLIEPKQAALLLATLQVDATHPQPITTIPVTVEVSGKPVVIVATGRYLGTDDITDTTQQSIYAIKDPLSNTGWGNVRTDTSHFVQQSFSLPTTTTASVTTNLVNFTTKGGWWIDLPHSKERVFTNMTLQLNTLVLATAIPSGDACASGGESWRYYLNASSGSTVTSNPVGIRWSDNSLIVGDSWVKDINGNVRVIYQNSDGSIVTETPQTAPPGGSGNAHRTSWRELVD